MASYVRYDPNQTPNPVVEYIPYVNTQDYQGKPNSLINPDLSAVTNQPMKYWKHVTGAIQLMTAQEQASVDAAITSANLTGSRAAALNIFSAQDMYGKAFRALKLVMIDELNAIRTLGLINLTARTVAQIDTAIQNKINAGTADAP